MNILIVDDDDGIRWVLNRVLSEAGYHVEQASTLDQAKNLMEKNNFSLVYLDVYLPDGNGMDAVAAACFSMPVVLLTAESTFGNASKAYDLGVLEYLPKPFDLDEVRKLAQRVQDEQDLNKNLSLNEDKKIEESFLQGQSPVMQHLFRTLGKVAASGLTVLITGESGTGKELVAQLLHRKSKRSHQAFVAINTAAIPSELMESELFGHEKGAFTGADKQHIGRFEQANGGTLFLDEIGDMPISLQVKILRVLETGTVQRVGGKEDIAIDIHLLAATHQDLLQLIKEKSFREDLYYRLNVIPVRIPALRERQDDIKLLAEHLLQEVVAELGMPIPILLEPAADLLCKHDWPGNVRELKNVMRRLAVLTPGAAITVSDVALALDYHGNPDQVQESLSQAVYRNMHMYLNQLGHASACHLYQHMLAEAEPALLKLALEHCDGNQIKASKMLGLNRNTVRKMLTTYQICSADYRKRR
ncbi:MAG: sigma-54 dependent transcriptional regulator [Mariprofundaceae bacterium]|nr:sigma-54 dependent transcriptional regulator [Mariprofundaceae bacterium]